MESVMESSETLNDYIDFFKQHLTKEDKEEIAKECVCSLSTLYNYIAGKNSNIHLSKAILESGKNLLKKRGVTKNEVQDI